MFSRRYWLMTVLVVAAVAVCVWAGFWQMDRRQQKRALNQMIAERWQMPAFDLNRQALPQDLVELEYRKVQVEGRFDFANQVVLKNHTRNNAPGVNLITPLVLEDGRAILVARGWIPLHKAEPESWGEFDEPSLATVVGLIQESQTLANAATPEAPQQAWFRVDVAAIERQMPYELLPAFLAMLPEPGRRIDVMPLRSEPPAPLDEYMHVGYTVQWFSFAAIFAFGYIQYLIMQERRRRRMAAAPAGDESSADLPTLPHQA